MKDLNKLRNDIDKLDTKLCQLLSERYELSRQVAESKLESGLPIYRPERESEIISNLNDSLSDNEFSPHATAAYRSILRTSREYQYYHQMKNGKSSNMANKLKSADSSAQEVKTVCFQGIKGSWSSIAAKKAYPNAELMSVPTFSDVFSTVAQGKAQVGILPLDNSTAGSVNDVYDLLLKNDFYIVKALPLQIKNSLMALPGVKESEIRTVLSHPQALSQCAEHIKALGAMPVSATNTAVAAHTVSISNDLSVGAIASPSAAEEYSLEIINAEFNDSPCNQTRFLAVCPKFCLDPNSNRISFAFSAPNESGALSNVLSVFADNGVNLTKIMSRPAPERAWEYIFYLDCETELKNDMLNAVLNQLDAELPWIRLLGCYRESELTD